MRYKIIATILTVILMLTNVLPILASQDEAADPDADAAVTWDAGDTAGEMPGEYTDADGDDNSTDGNESEGSAGEGTEGKPDESIGEYENDKSSDGNKDEEESEEEIEGDSKDSADEGEDADGDSEESEDEGKDTDGDLESGDDEDVTSGDDEDQDDLDDELYDTTAPVIVSVEVDKQEQSVQVGDTVTITIDAYDDGVGIGSIEIYQRTNEGSSYIDIFPADTVKDASGKYVIQIVASGRSGPRFIQVIVYDKHDNKSSEGGYGNVSYMYNVIRSTHVTDVSLTKDDGTPLSSTDMLRPSDTIHVTVTAVGALGEGQIWFRAKEYNCGDINIMLTPSTGGTSAETKLEGELHINTSNHPGEYIVSCLYVWDENGNRAEELYGPGFSHSSELLTNIGFTVLNEGCDIEAPRISNISLDRKTQIVHAEDKVIVSATVTDNTSEITEVYAEFLILGNSNSEKVMMARVGDSDTYQGVLEITKDTYPSEWMLTRIYAIDSATNYISVLYDDEGYALRDMYYVQVYNGNTFVNPAYDVTFYSINEDGKLVSKTVKVPRRTSFEELNSLYLPEKNSNLIFQNWNQVSAWLDILQDTENYGLLGDRIFYAQYDKKLITMELHTRNESGTVSEQCITIKKVYAKPGDVIELPKEVEGYKDIIWYDPNLDAIYSGDTMAVVGYNDPYPIMQISGSAVYVGDDELPTDSNPELGDNSNTWPSDSTQDSSSNSQTTVPGNTTGGRRNAGNTMTSQGASEAFNDSDASSDVAEHSLIDEQIAEIVAKIRQAASGDTITVDMGKTTIVSKEILEAAQGKDVNIVLQMDGYTWTINGKNILSPSLKDIDLMVIPDTTNIPGNTIKELAGDNPVKQISLVHEGNFGFSATLTINIGSDYASRRGQLYYHDSSGRMMFIDAGDIGEDGNVSLTFSHASDYAIVIHESLVVMPDEGTVSTKAGALFAIQVACVCGIAACIYMIKKEKKKAKADRRAEEFAA